MKTKDIAQKYGIDQMDFEEYLKNQKIDVQYTFGNDGVEWKYRGICK